MTAPILSQQFVQQLYAFDADTGLFTHRFRNASYARFEWWNSRFGGKLTTLSVNSRGYRQLVINGKPYQAHRIAWLYHYGKLPDGQIDHINQIKTDNRIVNLREVSNAENCRNQKLRKNNTSGVIGVKLSRSKNKWQAFLSDLSLGAFDRKEDAIAARKKAADAAGYSINHGKSKHLPAL